MNTGSGNLSSGAGASTKIDDSSKPTTSGNNMECESQRVLSNLPQAELRLLCSLLAQEGYAYWPLLVDFCQYAWFATVYLFAITRTSSVFFGGGG